MKIGDLTTADSDTAPIGRGVADVSNDAGEGTTGNKTPIVPDHSTDPYQAFVQISRDDGSIADSSLTDAAMGFSMNQEKLEAINRDIELN